MFLSKTDFRTESVRPGPSMTSTRRSWRGAARVGLAIALLLVPQIAAAGSGATSTPTSTTPSQTTAATNTVVQDQVQLPTNWLDASLPMGDHTIWQWFDEISALGGEEIVFRWRTSELNVASGRWTLYDASNSAVRVQSLPGAPAGGDSYVFTIDLSQVAPSASYHVEIQSRDANGTALGEPSPPVEITIVAPSSMTQFTDDGLGVSLGPVLEEIRGRRRVPALGGAIVTETGISTIGVGGLRRGDNPTTVQIDDRWHLGSDVKAMTATLFAILAQRGEVSWGLRVSDAFPEWSGGMDVDMANLGVRELLAHRSGILQVSNEEKVALANEDLTIVERRREFVRLITHHGPHGIPGVTYSYQNGNFVIVAAMLERLTGQSWEDLIQDELFDPLGMDTAGFDAPGVGQQIDEPWGHSDVSGMRVATRGDAPASRRPSGGVHASLRDWGKFIRLHLTGSEGGVTLYPWTLSALHEEYQTDSNPLWPTRYGWGWIMFEDASGDVISHDGSNLSWYCRTNLYLDEGFAVLAVTNIGPDDHGNGRLAVGDLATYLRDRYREVAAAPVPSKITRATASSTLSRIGTSPLKAKTSRFIAQ